jgi:hypothetical protein
MTIKTFPLLFVDTKLSDITICAKSQKESTKEFIHKAIDERILKIKERD